MAIKEVLAQMLCLLALTAVIWLIVLFARVMTTPLILLCWGVLSGVTAAGMFQRARVSRRLWLQARVLSHSPLHVWLRGGILMALGQSLLALFVTAVLLLMLIRRADPVVWSALLGAALALPPLAALGARTLAAHATPPVADALGRRAAMLITALMLLVFWVWQAFGSSSADLRPLSLEQAVWAMVTEEQARSGVLVTGVQMLAALDAVGEWGAQRLLPAPVASAWQGFGWAVLLCREALFVWSFLLCCEGALRVCDTKGAVQEPRREAST